MKLVSRRDNSNMVLQKPQVRGLNISTDKTRFYVYVNTCKQMVGGSNPSAGTTVVPNFAPGEIRTEPTLRSAPAPHLRANPRGHVRSTLSPLGFARTCGTGALLADWWESCGAFSQRLRHTCFSLCGAKHVSLQHECATSCIFHELSWDGFERPAAWQSPQTLGWNRVVGQRGLCAAPPPDSSQRWRLAGMPRCLSCIRTYRASGVRFRGGLAAGA